MTLGVRTIVPISWPATLGTTAGSGDFVLETLVRLTADGNTLTGEGSPCHSTLPAYTYTGIIGGGMGRIDIPDSVWDTPGFPAYPATAAIGGWESGSSITFSPGVSLAGLTLADPSSAWPDSYSDIETADPDDDGYPGITAIPATGQGFASPPVSIVGPRADRIYLVVRRAVALAGQFTSCTEMSGTANVEFFDNHVVGCRIANGSSCNSTQTDFVDSNRTIYETGQGTFTAHILSDAATCADVRAMP